MATELLTEKYKGVLDGVLHCYDRVVLTGSLQPWSYAQGMTGYLYGHDIRIFDYVQFAQPLVRRETALTTARSNSRLVMRSKAAVPVCTVSTW